jgi:AcrR family transcriptional regulator
MRALPGRTGRSSLGQPPPQLTRDRVRQAQRDRILRAIGELVAKRGYLDVTVEMIVKRSRVSFKTFYRQFSGKEECFLAFLYGAFSFAERRVVEALGDRPDATWPEQIIITLRALADLILADPLLARACVVEAPTAGPAAIQRCDQATKSLVPLLRLGREHSGRGAELPGSIEETLAGSVVWSVYQRLINGESDRIVELLPEAVELVLRPYLGEAEAVAWARRVPAGIDLETGR